MLKNQRRMPTKELQVYKDRLKQIEPFINTTVQEVTNFSEPVMIQQHICNTNLQQGVTKKHPRSGYDTPIKT
jgi:hypothetical protein